MKRKTRWVGLLVAMLCAACGICEADAKTLRWASRGDVQTLDPHSNNEILTTNIVMLIHDPLVERDRAGRFGPRLATSWSRLDATTWRFELRRGVRFHDGSPFTADDVVFSIERAQSPPSSRRLFSQLLGKVVKVDDYTVELRQDKPDPLLLEHLNTIYIVSRAWCIAHRVEKALDYAARQDTFTALHANGTGPYRLVAREPGVRTVLDRNPDWWSRAEGDVTRVVHTPIASDATRTTALLSGELDLVHDPAPQDLPRFRDNPGFEVFSGIENRMIFMGFDHYRDALEGSDVTDRNPFRDRRVREAFLHAIDVHALNTKIMRGQSMTTGCFATSPAGCPDPSLESHAPADLAAARALMIEAGYPDGFTLTLDCPNDLFVNDRELCVAIAGMLARIGVRVRANAMPKAVFYRQIDRYETSFYLLGTGGTITDPLFVLDTLLHTHDPSTRKGNNNLGRFSDPELDRLIDAASIEMDPAKRAPLVREAIARQTRDVRYLVLLRPMLHWVARKGVTPLLQPNNLVRVEWITIVD